MFRNYAHRAEVFVAEVHAIVADRVQGTVARAGSDEIGLDPMGLNQTDTYLLLKPR